LKSGHSAADCQVEKLNEEAFQFGRIVAMCGLKNWWDTATELQTVSYLKVICMK